MLVQTKISFIAQGAPKNTNFLILNGKVANSAKTT